MGDPIDDGTLVDWFLGVVHSKLGRDLGTSERSFLILGGAAVLLLLAFKIYSLLQYPSVVSVQEKANEAVPPRGDNNSITIWGFHGVGEFPSYSDGLPDGSSFTGRVECFLRLHGKFDYVKRCSDMMSENPRGLMPVANIRGTMVDDSARIIRVLKETLQITDIPLTPEQAATGHMVQIMMTSSFSRVLLHIMFLTEDGRRLFWDDLSGKVPFPVRPFVKAMIFRNQADKLTKMGVATTPEAQLFAGGREDLRALSVVLGDQKFILGTDKPTDADVDIYIYVRHMFFNYICKANPWSQKMRKEFPTLVAHTERMREIMFPELVKESAKKTQ